MKSKLSKAILSLEGNIAAGKSTQFERLKQHLAKDTSVVFVPEPVAEWQQCGLLERMYNKDIDLAVFQLAVLMSLTVPLVAAINKPDVKLVVTERSPASNALTFAEINLNEKDMQVYSYALKKSLEQINNADHFMAYLQIPVEGSVQRMKKRARKEEDGKVDQSYLELLHDKHESLLERALTIKGKSIIDASRDEDSIFDSLKSYVNSILIERGDDF